MANFGMIDTLFIVFCFIGVWIFSTSASAISVLLPQQIADLQVNNKLFAGNVSWLANRQNHTIRICGIANMVFLGLICLVAGKQPFTVELLKSGSSILFVGYMILVLLTVMSLWIWIESFGQKFGEISPTKAIQITALPTKIGYIILYPLLALNQFFDHPGSE